MKPNDAPLVTGYALVCVIVFVLLLSLIHI